MSSRDDQSELKELRQQLELVKSQLESRDQELYVANSSLLEAEVKVQEAWATANQLEEQIHTARLEAELDKLRTMEALREELDVEKRIRKLT